MSYQLFAQVTKAVDEMMDMILNRPDERFFLLMASMQSGKTAFIEVMYTRLKQQFPDAIGLYVVAHNQKDFIGQNHNRLEHLESMDFYCLTLKDRRLDKIKKRPQKSFQNTPIFVFFDENHFGDGCEQTVDLWLARNGLYPRKQTYMIGISATPFSSALRAQETTVRFDLKLMPKYKSVTTMLKNGDIEEATPLLGIVNKKFTILKDTPVYKYMEKIILNNDSGYCILRIPQQCNALLLEKELKKIFGKKIHVRHWNQKNPIGSAVDYFSYYRLGVVTIVLLQQKARMGSTIPTDHIRMVYEFSPSGAIATIAQSLLGRMCGHGKLNHNVKVFTHFKQAEAFSLFENGKFDEFANFISAHQLKPSQRSKVTLTDGDGIVTEIFEIPFTSKGLIKKDVLSLLAQTYGPLPQFTKTVVRMLSKNKFEGYWYKEILNRTIDGTVDLAANKRLLRDGKNKTAILIDDRTANFKVYATFRLNDSIMKRTVIPKDSSIYSAI